MSALVLSADQVAAELEYLHRDGTGNGEVIRALSRKGDFPPPIDKDQPAVRWRWSRVVVERYVAGEWPWSTRPAVSSLRELAVQKLAEQAHVEPDTEGMAS